MLLFPNSRQPNFLGLLTLSKRHGGWLGRPTFYAKNFSADDYRPYPSLDITDAVIRSLPEVRSDLPWIVAVGYSSQQRDTKGEFLLELRTKDRFSEIHLTPTRGNFALTAGSFFDAPTNIISVKLYAYDHDGEDTITLHHLSLTLQFDPEAIIPDFRYSDRPYGYKSRGELEERAHELMNACYDYMLALRLSEDIAGNHSQDAILPFAMEYSHRRFPYIFGNLNGLYWYGLSEHQHLEHLTIDNGMRPGDTILDCGAHTGHVACAMAAIGGPNTKIICFDPFPQNNYLTDLNRRLNHFNIEVAGAGVGRETKSTLASNAYQLTVKQDHVPCKEYPLVALDDYYSTKPTYLKIDVEGFELEALLGAQKILRDLRPRVFIELHPQFFGMTGASYRKIYEAFPKDRYKLLLHHARSYGDAFEKNLDTEPLGNLYAEPIA